MRREASDTVHVFVEPAQKLKVLTGMIAISTTNDEAIVFALSNTNHLSFRVLDQDLLQLNARLLDNRGHELCRVVHNHVRVASDSRIAFDYRPGRSRITLPSASEFLPEWMIAQVRAQDPDFAADGKLVALDLQVLKPGLVRVQGCWPDGDRGVVITERALSFCTRGKPQPTSLVGDGEASVLLYAGPITQALFGFSQ